MAISTPTYSAVLNAISRTSVAVSGSGVGLVFVAGDDASDSITTVTWGGATMYKVNTTSVEVPGDRYISVWAIQDPASSATIEFNDNVENYWRNFNAFYPGATLTGGTTVDSQFRGTSAGAAVLSVATTVVASDCWIITFDKEGTGLAQTYTPSGVLSSMRAQSDAGGLAIADSNGTVGTGSQTATLTINSGTPSRGAITFSLAPAGGAVAPAQVHSNLLTLGVG